MTLPTNPPYFGNYGLLGLLGRSSLLERRTHQICPPCLISSASRPCVRLPRLLPSYLTKGALPYPSPILLPSYLLRYYSLTTRLLAIFSRIPIFPIYPTTTTTLSLHTVNTRNRTFENSLSTTQTPSSHAYYTQITQYPIFPRIHYALGISLIYRFPSTCCTSAPLHHPPQRDLRQSHCSPR